MRVLQHTSDVYVMGTLRHKQVDVTSGRIKAAPVTFLAAPFPVRSATPGPEPSEGVAVSILSFFF